MTWPGSSGSWSGVPGPPDADAFARCLAGGGVAVFPADTVYGLACDPEHGEAVARLYALKGRPPTQPSAVMFFDVALALDALPELGGRSRALLARLLPGGVTLLLPNHRGRFPLACGADPHTLGLRVPEASVLAGVGTPVLQSSANLSGGPDARRLEDVPAAIRDGADLLVDAGELPGTPSTVIDLRRFEAAGEWDVVRAGAVERDAIARTVAASSKVL
ncbi:MAG: L-threonylcarbamoyladenylate synthase [Solirubrobacteraceae bacterium]|nr:L-threonylcarbamoyladenylate synthase [Solirubrobacteraceae bacterium]